MDTAFRYADDTDSPQVTLVVPVHNDAGWIQKALESALNQSESNIEIICIDDASTDESCALIEELESQDPRITLLKQGENKSAFQARRRGIFAASAPYVLFLDGDDELHPDAVRTALAMATAGQADMVGFGVEIITGGKSAPRRFEADLQPQHESLEGAQIFSGLFPPPERSRRGIYGAICGALTYCRRCIWPCRKISSCRGPMIFRSPCWPQPGQQSMSPPQSASTVISSGAE